MTDIQNLYTPEPGDEIIVWEPSPEYRGFSVLRDYPNISGFKPSVTVSGDIDTKILLKVGYSLRDVVNNKVPLYLNALKYSKYLSTHFRYDFTNPDSPTKESLEESKNSQQPIDLEDNDRFFFDITNSKITDKKTRKEITANELVEYMYGLHLQTIKGIKATLFKTQLSLKSNIWLGIYNTTNGARVLFINTNRFLFGKTIKETRDPLVGLFTPYRYVDLVTLYPQGIPFFTSDIRLSKQCIIYIAITLLFIWKLGYYHPAFRAMNDVYTIAVIVILIFIYDYFLPIIVLFLANIMIHIRRLMTTMSKLTRTKF